MKKELDIYDFDKTIVPFDSGTLFTLYCMVHYPWCILVLPVIAIASILMLMRMISFTQFKKTCFMYIPFIPKEKAVKRFWDKYEKDVNPWFQDKPRYAVVISASPDFLLEDISKRLGFDMLICTRHNKNGVIVGENCRGNEKVRRLYELFDKDGIQVVDVYSDSLHHDKPIFSLATNQCYHIVDRQKVPFNYSEKFEED